MLKVRGYDGIHWYAVHSPLSQAEFSRSHVALVSPSALVAHACASRIVGSAMSSCARAFMRENTSRQGRGLFGYRTVGPCHRRLEIGASFTSLRVDVHTATFASCRISVVSIALFELKSACISVLDTEYEGSSESSQW